MNEFMLDCTQDRRLLTDMLNNAYGLSEEEDRESQRKCVSDSCQMAC